MYFDKTCTTKLRGHHALEVKPHVTVYLKSAFLDNQIFLRTMEELVGNLQGHFRSKNFQEEADRNNTLNGAFPYIPLRPNLFIPQLLNVALYMAHYPKRYPQIKFLDAGCGPGITLLIAKNILSCVRKWDSYISGIELDKVLVDFGNKICAHVNSPIIQQADVLSFKDYCKKNLIYYYCPIANYGLQMLFEERLEDTIKVNTLLIPNLKQSHSIDRDARFQRIRMVGGATRIGFYVKVKIGPRKYTDLTKGDLTRIPKVWQKEAEKHYNKYKGGKNND